MRPLRLAGLVLTGLGLFSMAVGIVGVLTEEDDAPLDAAATSETTTSVAAEVTTTSAAPSTTTTEAPETPQEFYALWNEAAAGDDVDTLIARLHPGVLEFYGEEQCRGHVGRFAASIRIEFVSVGEPKDYDYGSERENRPYVVEDALPVDVVVHRGDDGGTEQVAHLARVDGQLRWFTDCGDVLDG
ncbi:MAG TPA: hypothetical protein VM618_05335 [Acidimicrobiia bacterium]|nr:hypothetical protein [Acidimicrobiia bacterium]